MRNSDKIVAINNGVVEEEGTHDDLMERKGLYHSLVTTQMNSTVEDAILQEKEEDVVVYNDALENMQVEESDMPSLLSIGSFSGTFNRKKSSVTRRISVLSNYSTYSEDSHAIEVLSSPKVTAKNFYVNIINVLSPIRNLVLTLKLVISRYR